MQRSTHPHEQFGNPRRKDLVFASQSHTTQAALVFVLGVILARLPAEQHVVKDFSSSLLCLPLLNVFGNPVSDENCRCTP
jgi:hypothetical protein